MIYQHNESTLLAGHRQAIYYPPNGTGRDTYIMHDNGGTNTAYFPQGVPHLGNFMKFGQLNRTYKPSSHTRFQKYISDGTGRDQYVVSHHGGQYAEDDQRGLQLRKFRDTIREGSCGKNQTAREWRVSKILERDRAVSEFQRAHSVRLSAPKRMVEKYEAKLRETRLSLAQK